MSTVPKILAFAGSLRQGSYNKKLVRIAATGAERGGAAVTMIDLRNYPLPLFDEDLEASEGQPDACRELKSLFREHDGLLIASPEYNSSFSGALKNTIDWVSRPEPDQPPLSCFIDKVAAVLATSPGGLGGLRGLGPLRTMLGNIRVTVIPDQIAVPSAADAFDEHGRLRDEQRHAAVEAIGEKLAGFLVRLGPRP